jgi:hypothetical protein
MTAIYLDVICVLVHGMEECPAGQSMDPLLSDDRNVVWCDNNCLVWMFLEGTVAGGQVHNLN